MKKNLIKGIVKGSIAEEMEIVPGDFLISVNGEEIKDILDYKFQIFDEFITIVIERQNGEEWELEIEKEDNEDLGFIFEEELIDKPRNCANKCIFCFMDQLPPNVRDTLVFKDDDFRLSFMTGNYVTLTNSGYKDLERIVRYHLSPINISVHATDSEVRKMMLNNKNADKILEYVEYLTKNGISINAQIVLCPGINDGEALDKTIGDLYKFYPELLCIAIVPVGLTKYREGLYPLTAFNKETASKVIDQVEGWQKKLKEETGSNIVYAADEFYVKAEREIPDYERYENFPQLEDGIGLMAYFTREFDEYLTKIEPKKLNKVVSIATGKSAYSFIKKKSDKLQEKFEGLKINVYPIENTFFGPEITVTGLITGNELIEQLKDREIGEYLIIDGKMLKSDEDIFLDDVSLKKVKESLGINIIISESSGEGFIKAIID